MLEFGGPIRPCPGALAGAVICLWSPSDSDLTSKSNLDQSTCPLLSKKCIGKGDSFTLNDIAGSTYKGMRVFPSITRLMENNSSRSGRTQSLQEGREICLRGGADIQLFLGNVRRLVCYTPLWCHCCICNLMATCPGFGDGKCLQQFNAGLGGWTLSNDSFVVQGSKRHQQNRR